MATKRSTKRKLVVSMHDRPGKDGPINLVKVVYTDGRTSYGVSASGSLTLFGPDYFKAYDYYAVVDLPDKKEGSRS